MRVIVAGSRSAKEGDVRHALDTCPWIGFVTAIVSGTARGADEFGERWAEDHKIAINRFPADWKKYGKRAGPVRNEIMAENAEGLIAVWDGVSRGTASMIGLAKKHGLRIEVMRTDLGRFDEIQPTGDLASLWEFVEERAAILEFGSAELPRREAEHRAAQISFDYFFAFIKRFDANRERAEDSFSTSLDPHQPEEPPQPSERSGPNEPHDLDEPNKLEKSNEPNESTVIHRD